MVFLAVFQKGKEKKIRVVLIVGVQNPLLLANTLQNSFQEEVSTSAQGLRWAPPHTGSPARNPGRVRKESGKSTPAQGPKSAPRGALFRHFWGPAPGHSFRTLFGLFRGSGPEGPGRPCVGRGPSQPKGPPKSGLRVSVCILSLHFMTQLLGRQQRLPKNMSG